MTVPRGTGGSLYSMTCGCCVGSGEGTCSCAGADEVGACRVSSSVFGAEELDAGVEAEPDAVEDSAVGLGVTTFGVPVGAGAGEDEAGEETSV